MSGKPLLTHPFKLKLRIVKKIGRFLPKVLLLAEAMANVNESFVSHLASQGTLYAFLLSGQTYGTKRPNFLTNGTNRRRIYVSEVVKLWILRNLAESKCGILES